MRYSFLVLFTIIAFSSSAQDSLTFPASFVGRWTGQMKMISVNRKMEFKMQLVVSRINDKKYSWQIQYGDSSKDIRPYELIKGDSLENHWIIDEKNSILLDGYVFGNTFQGAFTVEENTIYNSFRLEKDELHVTFSTIKLGSRTTTGGKEDVPLVDSYKIAGYQYGILKRK